MNNKIALVSGLLLVALAFVVGYYSRSSGEENTDFQNQISGLQEENSQLQTEITQLQEENIQISDDNKILGEQVATIIGARKCPDGQFLTTRPTTIPPSDGSFVFYCRENKEWEDFGNCASSSDCATNYSCVSRINNDSDYRCIPFANWPMNCFCSPSGGCVCA